MIQGNEFVRRLGAQVRFGADNVDPLHQVPIELGIAAHRRIHPVAAFDQAGQDVVDIGDGEGIVGAEITDRAFGTGTQAVPQFALGITFATEQHVSPCGRPGISTITASGSGKPLRYWKSLSWR